MSQPLEMGPFDTAPHVLYTVPMEFVVSDLPGAEASEIQARIGHFFNLILARGEYGCNANIAGKQSEIRILNVKEP